MRDQTKEERVLTEANTLQPTIKPNRRIQDTCRTNAPLRVEERLHPCKQAGHYVDSSLPNERAGDTLHLLSCLESDGSNRSHSGSVKRSTASKQRGGGQPQFIVTAKTFPS